MAKEKGPTADLPAAKLVIDEFGRFFETETNEAITYSEQIDLLIENLKLTEQFILETHDHDFRYTVEAVDHPIMAQLIRADQSGIWITAQNGREFLTQKEKFSFDYNEHLCGLTNTGAPFRLTTEAMDAFFNACDESSESHFVLGGVRIKTPDYYFENSEIAKPSYWENVYETEGDPRWNLHEPAAALKDMLPKLKLPKSRILILGCGEGHDAAFFAEAGHVVTAVDFSKHAIELGRKKYGKLSQLEFIQSDIFALDSSYNKSFDLIFEHTCFCAVVPSRRKELVQLWSRLLHEQGQLMGVFFTMLKRAGPPYGASELEIKSILKKNFQTLMWQRFQKSIPQRASRELFVLAQKRTI